MAYSGWLRLAGLRVPLALWLVVGAVIGFSLNAGAAFARANARPADGSVLSPAFETDVNYSGLERSGEPELAVDPFSARRLAVSAFDAVNTYTNPLTFAQRALAPNSSWCSLQFSDDAGNGWSNEAIAPQSYTEPANSPFTPGKVHTNTTDCMLAWGPNGRLYEGGAVFVAEPAQPGQASLGGINFPLGGDSIASTTDGGRTFTQPIDPINSEDVPSLLARGLTPSTNGFANPFDRPWLRVDQSTGVVYLAATGHPQYYVTASHDQGRTWSRLEALDCDERTPPSSHEVCGAYPEIGGALIDAAHGVLSAAYLAGSPSEAGGGGGGELLATRAAAVTCPCVIFETSTDGGQHWTRHVVVDNMAANSSVQVAADPNNKHNFAVDVIPGSKVALQIYTTDDSGKTWHNPVSLGDISSQHVINRPWIAYSPQGYLGAFWRTAFPPFQSSFLQSGTQNVYVALSEDNGRTFSTPEQLNAAPSPPPDPTQIAQDDVSWVALTERHIYAAWGDWTSTLGNPKGDMNTWFGRASFTASISSVRHTRR